MQMYIDRLSFFKNISRLSSTLPTRSFYSPLGTIVSTCPPHTLSFRCIFIVYRVPPSVLACPRRTRRRPKEFSAFCVKHDLSSSERVLFTTSTNHFTRPVRLLYFTTFACFSYNAQKVLIGTRRNSMH